MAKAEELCKKHGWFLCRQFENEANPAYHAQTTGPEVGSGRCRSPRRGMPFDSTNEGSCCVG